MRAVLFIHGFLAGPDDWDTISSYLAPCYDRVEFFKQPGHERLDSDTKPNMKLFTAKEAYKQLDDLYDKLEKEYDEIDVIGHSMGGAMGVYLAANRNVHKLVLVSPSTIFLRADYLVAKNNENERMKKITQTNNGFAKIKETNDSEFKKSVDKAIERSLPYLNPATVITLAQISNKGRKCLSRVKTPLLVMWGKLDEFIPEKGINEIMQKTISKIKYRIDYDNYGHAMIFLSYCRELASDMKAFLTGKSLFKTKSTKYPMKTITAVITGKTATTITKKIFDPSKTDAGRQK